MGTEPKKGPASVVGKGAASERRRDALCTMPRGWSRRRRTSGNESVGWAAERSALADESTSCIGSNMLADEASRSCNGKSMLGCSCCWLWRARAGERGRGARRETRPTVPRVPVHLSACCLEFLFHVHLCPPLWRSRVKNAEEAERTTETRKAQQKTLKPVESD